MKPSTTEHIGTMVGRYKLLEQIGEGGCVPLLCEQCVGRSEGSHC
ncbi:MAG: hypothetical protein Q7R41_16730 [Phycisphaerales bacterium]|nr:hypothetical protein [Phycisphaerales bacterium]